MSQRGLTKPNFPLNKYNPLQLRGLEQQQKSRSTAPPFPQLPFTPRQPNVVTGSTASNDGLSSSILEATVSTDPQQRGLYDSIDNITLWCQQLECCKHEVEKQLENSLAEVGFTLTCGY